MRINEALHVNNSGRVPAQRRRPGNVRVITPQKPLERQVSGPKISEWDNRRTRQRPGTAWTQILAAATVVPHGCLRTEIPVSQAPHCRVHQPFLVNCMLQRGWGTTAHALSHSEKHTEAGR